MGLIKCPDCGGKVSDSAPVCIHCGRQMCKKYRDVDEILSEIKYGKQDKFNILNINLPLGYYLRNLF